MTSAGFVDDRGSRQDLLVQTSLSMPTMGEVDVALSFVSTTPGPEGYRIPSVTAAWSYRYADGTRFEDYGRAAWLGTDDPLPAQEIVSFDTTTGQGEIMLRIPVGQPSPGATRNQPYIPPNTAFLDIAVDWIGSPHLSPGGDPTLAEWQLQIPVSTTQSDVSIQIATHSIAVGREGRAFLTLAVPATGPRTFEIASSNSEVAELGETTVVMPAGYAFAMIPIEGVSPGIYHLEVFEDGDAVASSARRTVDDRNLATPEWGDSASIPPDIPPIQTQPDRICRPAAPVSGIGSYEECGPCAPEQSGTSNACAATVILSKPAHCSYMQAHTCTSAGTITLQSQRMILAGSELKDCGSQSTQSGISLFWGLITFGAQTTTQQDLKQWCCSYVPSDDGPTGSTNVPECQ